MAEPIPLQNIWLLLVGGRPSWGELVSDQIGRNESADRFMVALARMVFDAVVPSKEAGRLAGGLPDAQDHLIRRLFERAVGNALRLELAPRGWQIAQGRRLAWPASAMSAGMAAILPGMQTDIALNYAETGRRIVMDTKFTAILTQSSYRDQILRSSYRHALKGRLQSRRRRHEGRQSHRTHAAILVSLDFRLPTFSQCRRRPPYGADRSVASSDQPPLTARGCRGRVDYAESSGDGRPSACRDGTACLGFKKSLKTRSFARPQDGWL